METLDILVVNDRAEMREGAKRILNDFTVNVKDVSTEVAFHVSTAESGEKALELISGTAPHILLLDHRLPGISGIEVMEQVAGVNPEMLIIMITSYDAMDTSIRASRLGAFDFLPKPFTPTELKSVIKKAATHIIVTLQAKKLAEEKKQVRFQFISVLAHELKSPINAVEGYLKLMQDKDNIADAGAFDHMVDRSLTRICFMRKLIIDLLDMTRIESGKKQRDFSEVDVVDVARISIESVLPSAQERGITIHLETPDPALLKADRDEIEIITNNLISNAVKYNRDNGDVYVRIARKSGEIIHLCQGYGNWHVPGRNGKTIQRFRTNQKRENTEHPGKRTRVVYCQKNRRNVRRFGFVESEPDVGSTFTARLIQAVSD